MKNIFLVTALLSTCVSYSFPDDYFELTVHRNARRSEQTEPVDCRAHIRDVVCLVNPVASVDSADPATRQCFPGGEAYAPVFEAIYDAFPDSLQKMFCSLDYLFIEREFVGTAYAGSIKDATGKIIGAQMGIRKSVIDERLSLQQWASWKDQLNFGGDPSNYNVDVSLPEVSTRTSEPVNDFLYFVIAHEFGHLFDFANKLNAMENCPEPTKENPNPDCAMAPGSWGSLSWITNHAPKPENDFLNRKELCFYWCKTPLAPVAAPQVYDDLFFSSFISLYSTSQPWDDFADSLAYVLLKQQLRSSYIIDTKDGVRYDVMTKLDLPYFSSKKDYLQKFLSDPAIVYP